MKILTTINQNIPIWAVIKGDQACVDSKNYLQESLLKTPDFMDPRENALRKAYLRDTPGRRWVHNYLDGASFALVSLDRSDIESVLTVWKDVPLMELAKQYEKAYKKNKGFSFKRVEKAENQVIDVHRRKQPLPVPGGTSWLTEYDESMDYHRGIWMKRRSDSKFQIIDGTHRALATAWRYLLGKDRMPSVWYAIMRVE